MMSAGSPNSQVTISVFRPILAPLPSEARSSRTRLTDLVSPPVRNAWGSGLCVGIIVAAHLAILVPYLRTAPNHNTLNATADIGASSSDASMQAFFLESDDEAASSAVPDLADAPSLTPPPPPTVDVPQDVLLDTTAVMKPAATQTEADGNSVMAGRYLGQIERRIERAWLRPKKPVTGDRFECQVRVQQDSAGRVLEIELSTCNGDSQWQQSLVQAIQAASPLPAPPDPTVFRRRLRLSFTAHAYSNQGPSDGYEP